jgi:ubiquinol-cytochrome c reductase cytochrome b subunit
MHYVPIVPYSFLIIKHIIRDIYNGSLLRYLHSNGAFFIFVVLYIHISRSILYQSYIYLFHSWISGIILYLFMLVIAFLGYVLPWGQLSYWGATVITNTLSVIPDLVEFICGCLFISNPTLNRFFILHFIMPFVVMGCLLLHILYLHFYGSSNPLIYNANNKITFYCYIVAKDTYGLLFLLSILYLQLGYGLLGVSHPDNALEVNILVTPQHIVPEWYFLCFYAKLKN